MVLVLKHIWVGLWTVLGALWCLVNGAKFVCVQGEEKALAFVNPGGLIKWYFGKARFAAMTMGATIVYGSDLYFQNRRIVEHELQHVRQGFKFGLIWPAVYYGASLVALANGKQAYYDNAFEVEARQVSEKK